MNLRQIEKDLKNIARQLLPCKKCGRKPRVFIEQNGDTQFGTILYLRCCTQFHTSAQYMSSTDEIAEEWNRNYGVHDL